MIQPGEHRIVAVNGTRTYGMLNNGQGTEKVKLIMPSGDITHQVEYAGPTAPGHSYVNLSSTAPEWGRNADSLMTAKWPTPMDFNSPNAILPGLSIQMNEILVNASTAPDSSGAWIEFYYPDTGQTQVLDPSTIAIHTGTGVMNNPLPANFSPGELYVYCLLYTSPSPRDPE